MKKLIFYLLITITFLLQGCSSDYAGSTTVESPYIVLSVFNSSEEVVPRAKVSLYPSNYNPLIDDVSQVREKYSDQDGKVKFDSVGSGEYSIIVDADSLVAINYPVLIENQKSRNITTFVKPGNEAHVHTDKEAYDAYFEGTPYIGSYRAKDSTYQFKNIPAGLYPPLNVTNDSTRIRSRDIIISADSVTEIYIDSLVILDGTKFSIRYEVPKYSNTSSDPINCIASIQGKSWYGTDTSGVIYDLPNGEYMRMSGSEEDHVLNSPILELATCRTWKANHKDIYMIRTATGTFQYLDANPKDLAYENLLHMGDGVATAVDVDPNGKCWVAYKEMVYCTNPETGEWDYEINGSENVNAFAGAYESVKYLGKEDGTIKAFNNDTSFIWELKINGELLPVKELEVNSAGVLYAGSVNSLYEIRDGSAFSIYETGEKFHKIVCDESDILYGIFGKNSVFKYDGVQMFIYENIGGDKAVLKDVTVSEAGELSIAAGDLGVIHFTP